MHTTESGITEPPGRLPLLGHTLPLLRDPVAFLNSLPAHGDLVRIRIGPVTAIVVCGPRLVRQVLLDDRTFDKGGPLYDRFREIVGNGLATCPHSLHRRQRRLVQPAFHPARMPGYAHTMTAQLAGLTGGWHDGQILDVPRELTAFAIRVTVESMFSGTLPPSAVQDIVTDLTTIMHGIYRRMLVPFADRLPTPGNRRYDRAIARLRHVLTAGTAERRAGPAVRDDLLGALLTARDPDDGPGGEQGMSDTEICDQLVTFLIGGSETSAHAICWALHLLARHPDVERRLHAEVDAVLDGGPARHEHLPRLPVTDRVITEILRLYPIGWMFTRTTTQDTTLDGHPIPAGTTIVYSPYVIHHRGDLFTDPERFDPDRWISDRPRPGRGDYIPFGAGARQCIGNTYAAMEATLALASIAARWRLRPLPGERVRMTAMTTLTPHPLHMRATARGVAYSQNPRPGPTS